MLSGPKQSRRNRKRSSSFQRLDRNTGGDATVQGNLDHVIGWRRRRLGGRRTKRCERAVAGGCGAHRRLGGDVFRLTQNFERTGPVGQAPDEATFLQRRDQPMHARFRLEIERFLHFLERRGNTGLFQLGLDEADQFVLLAGQHERVTP